MVPAMSAVTFEQLQQAWTSAPPLPRDRAPITLLVVRTAQGARETPPRIELSPELGVVGDTWAAGSRNPETQVTVMMTRVASLIGSGGQPLSLAGDNLLADLDLSEDNLPTGSRLRAGSALLEVSQKPHLGCNRFSARFGPDALRWINWRPNRPHRLRGIHCAVVEPGWIEVGDHLEVVGRPT
jgi:MOSC domain-containing protein YiiM